MPTTNNVRALIARFENKPVTNAQSRQPSRPVRISFAPTDVVEYNVDDLDDAPLVVSMRESTAAPLRVERVDTLHANVVPYTVDVQQVRQSRAKSPKPAQIRKRNALKPVLATYFPGLIHPSVDLHGHAQNPSFVADVLMVVETVAINAKDRGVLDALATLLAAHRLDRKTGIKHVGRLSPEAFQSFMASVRKDFW
jgi:hypothetical protein